MLGLDKATMRYSRLWLLILGALLTGGCLKPEPPTVTFVDNNFRLTSFTSGVLTSRFTIANPNPIPLSGRATYGIFIDDKNLFKGAISDIHLLSAEESELVIETKISLGEALGSLKALAESISSGQRSIDFSLRGSLDIVLQKGLFALPLVVPIAASGEIYLPIFPTIALTGIAVERLDFSGIALKISTALFNSNEFPLSLDSLKYSLQAETKKIFSGTISPKKEFKQGETDVSWIAALSFDSLDGDVLDVLRNDLDKISLETEFSEIK